MSSGSGSGSDATQLLEAAHASMEARDSTTLRVLDVRNAVDAVVGGGTQLARYAHKQGDHATWDGRECMRGVKLVDIDDADVDDEVATSSEDEEEGQKEGAGEAAGVKEECSDSTQLPPPPAEAMLTQTTNKLVTVSGSAVSVREAVEGVESAACSTKVVFHQPTI